MPSTPDTAPYLYLGLVAVFTVVSLFLITIWLRYRALRADLKRIERYTASPDLKIGSRAPRG